jgi:hypothetical protein
MHINAFAQTRFAGEQPLQLVCSALASVSEKVVSRTRASGCLRAWNAARWRATMVFVGAG